ncbi:MAG: tRNA lysidine(34) synthetase TilS, partial [Ruminococcaceae bacterium]|nr:tRNA lysidine(34) synthetase TilS [Oscillospiraceae bacterium]
MTEVISAIRSFKFLDNEKHIAVALSGGADSMALLYGLYMLKEELGITVSALHLNHCLRGEEADRDEAFVRKECKKLGIPLTVKRVDIKAVAKKTGESIELAARNERYRFFEENKGDAVATAHNADDNLETVIYRLTRATGIDGLCGIPSRRDYFIRPLLCCQRKDIEKFLSENGVEYVTDSTNLSDDYTRNRIRHNVIPVLKELNESVYESFDTTVKILKDDSEYLNLISQEEFEKRFKNEKLCLDGFELLHNSIASRVIGKFLEN